MMSSLLEQVTALLKSSLTSNYSLHNIVYKCYDRSHVFFYCNKGLFQNNNDTINNIGINNNIKKKKKINEVK